MGAVIHSRAAAESDHGLAPLRLLPPETTTTPHHAGSLTPAAAAPGSQKWGFSGCCLLFSLCTSTSPLRAQKQGQALPAHRPGVLFLHSMGKLLMRSYHSPSCHSPNNCHVHEQTLQSPHLLTGGRQTTSLPVAATPWEGGTWD